MLTACSSKLPRTTPTYKASWDCLKTLSIGYHQHCKCLPSSCETSVLRTSSQSGSKSSSHSISDVSSFACLLTVSRRSDTTLLFLVSGLSASVLDDRNALILAQLETHTPNKERYSLIAKVVNVGVALLVYGRDDGVARAVCDVQTQWTGSGPGYMGNKGAVGVRFRVPGPGGGVGETFTCVSNPFRCFAGMNCFSF